MQSKLSMRQLAGSSVSHSTHDRGSRRDRGRAGRGYRRAWLGSPGDGRSSVGRHQDRIEWPRKEVSEEIETAAQRPERRTAPAWAARPGRRRRPQPGPGRLRPGRSTWATVTASTWTASTWALDLATATASTGATATDRGDGDGLDLGGSLPRLLLQVIPSCTTRWSSSRRLIPNNSAAPPTLRVWASARVYCSSVTGIARLWGLVGRQHGAAMILGMRAVSSKTERRPERGPPGRRVGKVQRHGISCARP